MTPKRLSEGAVGDEQPAQGRASWVKQAVGLVGLVLTLVLGCKVGPQARGLGEGPPALDGDLRELPVFDPAALAGSAATGELGRSQLHAGPPAAPAPPKPAPLPDPEVLGHGPQGEASTYPSIQIRFNRPMVPLGDKQRMPGVEAGFSFSPPIAGEAVWAEPNRLVFEPDDPLPSAQTFDARFTNTLDSVDGPALDVDLSWSFATQPPSVYLHARQRDHVGARYHWKAAVGLDANHPLKLSELRGQTRALTYDAQGNEQALAITIQAVGKLRRGATTRFEIQPKTRWPAGAEVVIEVDEALVGTEGPRPLGQTERYAFAIAEGVALDELRCTRPEYDDGCDLGPVELRFDSAVPKRAAKLIRIEPEPPGLELVPINRLRDERGRGRDAYGAIMLWANFQRGVDYTVRVDPSLVDVHAQPLVAEVAADLRFVEPPPLLRLASANTLDKSRATTIGIESRHVDRVEVQTALLDPRTVEKMLFGDLRWSEIEAATATKTETITLAHSGAWGWSSHVLDLARYTGDKPAAVHVSVGVDKLAARAAGRTPPKPVSDLVLVSELGASVLGSVSRSVLRVARLRDDAPVAGAAVELLDGAAGSRVALGQTDAAGLLELPSGEAYGAEAILHVARASDHLYVPVDRLAAGGVDSAGLRAGESVEVALTPDRQLYREGERVRAMGWAAISTPHELGGLRPLPAKTKVEVELFDEHGELVDSATVQAKDHGKFWATLDLPETASLGRYELHATLLGQTTSTRVRVEDFPTPEFQVSAASEASDVLAGQATTVRVDASYFFGGRVPIVRARATTRCSQVEFRPPGLDPSWQHGPSLAKRSGYGFIGYGTSGTGTGLSSLALGPGAAAGHLEYALVAHPGPISQPRRCTHSVALADATQRELGAETALMVHPDFYLAARTPAGLDEGEDARIELRTLDHAGDPVAVPGLEVRLERRWTAPRYAGKRSREIVEYQTRTKKLPRCRVDSEGQAACRFAKLDYGSYTVHVRAKQGDYEIELEDWFWVSPSPASSWRHSPPATLSIGLAGTRPGTPAQIGDAVRVQVSAPWSSGQALVTMNQGGIHELHVVELVDGRAEVPLTVADAWVPQVSFDVLAVEPGGPNKLPWPRRASTRLEVDHSRRELTVEVRAPREAETREQIPIEVVVHDHAGKPASGHVSVWAVDEAVLSLAPLELPDFVGAFVARSGWRSFNLLHSYYNLQLPYAARPDSYTPWVYRTRESMGVGGLGLVGVGRGGGGSGEGSIGLGSTGTIGRGGGGGASMPAPRSEFSSAPIFIGDAAVGPDGVARIEGTLPDNLTTFRLTAIASAPLADGSAGARVEARFGVGDARVRVTRPLVVRAAMPRVMRPGDQAELGLIVDNLGGGAGELEVEAVVHGGGGVLALLGPHTAKATLEAGAQLRLPFTLQAGGSGPAEVELRATLTEAGGAQHYDAVRLPLPVEPERTQTDRVAIYGSLDSDGAAALPFAIPADADPRFGGLSVSLSSSLLGGLEDAVAYLVRYPHGCLEQTSSALLPLIPLGSLARQGYPLGIEDLDAHVAHGVRRLQSMQLDSGGFSYWPASEVPAPYASAYATWVLDQADAAGYPVPAWMLDAATRYLDSELETWHARRGPELEADIEAAWMLWAQAERGRARAEHLDALYERRARLPVFAQAALLDALTGQARAEARVDPRSASVLTELIARVDEREAVAKVETDTRWTWYWDSDTRNSALVLLAMLEVEPMHPLAPKLARGLLEVRRGGRWSNTQENALALLALARYASIYEADPPDFEGRVWLGQSMLSAVAVEGRDFDIDHGHTPMSELLAAASAEREAARASTTPGQAAVQRLVLERAGTGRMYYRVGLEWASSDPDRPAAAEGIQLSRTLRAEAGPVADTAAVASGDLLAIDVELEVPAALDHVAIEVPLPAGIEPVNLDLGKGGAAMKLSGQRGPWVSHQELRRDRAVLYADHLEPGRHRTTVFARATTAGEYQMPAASAEMMYYPEVYGRTTARRLVVR